MVVSKDLGKFIVLIFVILISSCASRKDVLYLQDVNVSKKNIKTALFDMLKYKVDDRLTITVTSINPKAAQPYNLPVVGFNVGGAEPQGQQQLQSYLVDKNGEISFPQLGQLKIQGKNRIEVERYIEDKLSSFLLTPKVTVQLVNFRISILGEVNKPGQFNIEREKINVLQALGLAGDLSIHGKRDDIKLIREEKGQLVYYKIDLRSKELLSEPFFYLKQNDIIYVSPNKQRVNASVSSPTASYMIAATGLLVTIISILTR